MAQGQIRCGTGTNALWHRDNYYTVTIIMYIYHVLINTPSDHMIHINLNMIFYTHVSYLQIHCGQIHCATGTTYGLWHRDNLCVVAKGSNTLWHRDMLYIAPHGQIHCGTGTINTLWHRDKHTVAQGQIIRCGIGTNALWHRDKCIVAQGQMHCGTGTNT